MESHLFTSEEERKRYLEAYGEHGSRRTYFSSGFDTRPGVRPRLAVVYREEDLREICQLNQDVAKATSPEAAASARKSLFRKVYGDSSQRREQALAPLSHISMEHHSPEFWVKDTVQRQYQTERWVRVEEVDKFLRGEEASIALLSDSGLTNLSEDSAFVSSLNNVPKRSQVGDSGRLIGAVRATRVSEFEVRVLSETGQVQQAQLRELQSQWRAPPKKKRVHRSNKRYLQTPAVQPPATEPD